MTQWEVWRKGQQPIGFETGKSIYEKLPRWIALAVVAIQSACGPDGADGSLSRVTSPILNGEPDHQHPAVVLLVGEKTFCSGILIDPTWVLSAAHCLEENIAEILIGDQVIINGQVPQTTVRIPVAEATPHPRYDPESYENDIALLRLQTQAPPDLGFLPVLTRQQKITPADQDRSVQIIGYGPDNFDQQALGGTRLQGSRPIWLVCEESSGCEENLLGLIWNISKNSLCFQVDQGSPTPGDSGGPVVIQREGKEYIAGITSWMGSAESHLSGEVVHLFTCATKVDQFHDFIDDVIAGETGCRCSKQEIDPFPKNISLSILIIAVIGLINQRTRQTKRIKPLRSEC